MNQYKFVEALKCEALQRWETSPLQRCNASTAPNRMRRFSQRSHLVTLSEINITPLLDLAFVLLIIFIITTPLLTSNIPVQLPTGSKNNNQPLDPKSIRTVSIDRLGQVFLESK